MPAKEDGLATRIETALAPYGLNLVGVAPVAAYDGAVPRAYRLAGLLPGARSVVVVGNGGGAFWAAYRADRAAHPPGAAPHPLDAFTRRVVEAVAAPLVAHVRARFLYPFRFPEDPVSFTHLARCAGLGRPGLTGVLLHPRFGPWIALRAAILVAAPARAPRPADGFDPCPTCAERACVAACPAGAVTERGWDVPRCAAHRGRADDPCAPRCHARFACVIGRDHRYPADALAHHQAWARPGLLAAGGAG